MKIYSPVQLHGKRLILSPLLSRHGSSLWKQFAGSSQQIIQTTFKWFPQDPYMAYSEQDMQRIVEQALVQWQNRERVPFAIQKKSGGVIGSTSLLEISTYHKHAEIGITFLGPDHRGQGYNQEATRLLLRYLFEDLQYERVQVKAATDNHISNQSFQAIGFQLEGVLRSFQYRPDLPSQRGDVNVYSITKSDWPRNHPV